jgi:hypothetical protein
MFYLFPDITVFLSNEITLWKVRKYKLENMTLLGGIHNIINFAGFTTQHIGILDLKVLSNENYQGSKAVPNR